MTKPGQGVQRRESAAMERRRLRTRLIAYYRDDSDYQRLIKGELVWLWHRAHVRAGDDDADAKHHGAERLTAYQKALATTVSDTMRLRNAGGKPADWARREVHRDVVRFAGLSNKEPRPAGALPPLRVSKENLYGIEPWIEVYVTPRFLQVRGFWDEEADPADAEGYMQELDIGDEGFGDAQWDELRELARQHLDYGINEIKKRMEAHLANRPRWRPTTAKRQEADLQLLVQYLFHPRQRLLLERADLRRLAGLADRIGIVLPPR